MNFNGTFQNVCSDIFKNVWFSVEKEESHLWTLVTPPCLKIELIELPPESWRKQDTVIIKCEINFLSLSWLPTFHAKMVEVSNNHSESFIFVTYYQQEVNCFQLFNLNLRPNSKWNYILKLFDVLWLLILNPFKSLILFLNLVIVEIG